MYKQSSITSIFWTFVSESPCIRCLGPMKNLIIFLPQFKKDLVQKSISSFPFFLYTSSEIRKEKNLLYSRNLQPLARTRRKESLYKRNYATSNTNYSLFFSFEFLGFWTARTLYTSQVQQQPVLQRTHLPFPLVLVYGQLFRTFQIFFYLHLFLLYYF